MIDINELIDDCIDQLADDRVDSGVEALYDLAIIFKAQGMGATFFMTVCNYIEQEAASKSDEAFISTKIHNALVRVREKRNGTSIARVTH